MLWSYQSPWQYILERFFIKIKDLTFFKRTTDRCYAYSCPFKIFMILCPIDSQMYTNIDPHSTNAAENSRAMLVLPSYSFASFQNALDSSCQLLWRSIHSQAFSQKCCRFGDKGMVRFSSSHTSHCGGSWVQTWAPDLGDPAVPLWINNNTQWASWSHWVLESFLLLSRRLQHQVVSELQLLPGIGLLPEIWRHDDFHSTFLDFVTL